MSLASISQGQTTYQPCPLLRAYFPAPTLANDSNALHIFVQEFTKVFDDLLENSGSDDFGLITPNTTSFSVVLFSGAESVEESGSIFFEYHHTATLLNSTDNVTSETIFPAGTLTQLFTVYTWLVETGDGSWESPITEFLPELQNISTSSSSSDLGLNIDWDTVTVGSLASHMSGLTRDCKLSAPIQPRG